MKKLLSVVIALMMMVTFVFAEEAAPAEVKTLYAGVLTVGCEAGYPPFEMVADDGESVVGLDMDIMAAVAEKLGLQMQVVTTSFDGIFDGIGVNYDVVCSAVTITPDRMQNMLFSLPYITNYQAVVVPADKDVEILRAMGDWMKVNDEAIHGTGLWLLAQEGPTVIEEGGFSDGKPRVFTSEDFRFTCRGDQVYAIAMACPEDGVLKIRSLRADGEDDLSFYRKT